MTPIRIASNASVEYSSISAFSKNNRWLLLQHEGGFFGAHVSDGTFYRMLPAEVNHSSRPRWSRTDPDVLTYLAGNEIRQFDVGDWVATPLHAFNEYPAVDDHGEADLSYDGRQRVLSGKRNGAEEVFLFDLISLAKGPVFPQTETFDGLKLTPVGNSIVLSKSSGLYLLDRNKRVTTVNGHAVAGRYQGRDVLLWCSSADAKINANAIERIDLATGVMKPLAWYDWRQAFHISACDREFCLVSTYAPDNAMAMELWKVPFDETPPILLGETGGFYRDYSSQPKASLSRDGSRAVYCVDDGTTVHVDMIALNETAPVPPVPSPPKETRIDYSAYFGKSYFIMRPRSDGAVDIFEVKE